MNQEPPLRRRSVPIWIRLMLVFLLICSLLGGAVVGFNMYAAAKLRMTIAEYEADGETLDFKSLLPEPIPDEQNFCAIPELTNLADPELGRANRERIEAMALPEADPQRGPRPAFPKGALVGKHADLMAWAQWLTGEELASEAAAVETVDKVLSNDPELIQALIVGLDRPGAAWTPALRTRELPEILYGIQVPHFRPVRSSVLALSLLVQIADKRGDSKRAVDLARVQVRMAEAASAEPMWVGMLVGTMCLNEALNSAWTVCASGMTSPESINSLRFAIERLNVRNAMLQACRAELATGCQAMEYVKSENNLFKTMHDLSSSGDESREELSFIPAKMWSMFTPGLCDLNSVNFIKLGSQHLVRPIRFSGIATVAEGFALEDKLMNRRGIWHLDSIFVRLALPSASKVTQRVATTEAYSSLAIAACRLEVHFAEHGSYPETLDDLPPEMRYERTTTRYRLWLPGPDGEDDGGKRVLDPDHPEKTRFYADEYQGDWVWDYPED